FSGQPDSAVRTERERLLALLSAAHADLHLDHAKPLLRGWQSPQQTRSIGPPLARAALPTRPRLDCQGAIVAWAEWRGRKGCDNGRKRVQGCAGACRLRR